MKKEQQQYSHHKLLQQDKISLVAITWNLYGSLPPQKSLQQLFRSNCFKQNVDIIVIATQQCQRSLSASLFCQDKTVWEQMLIDVLTSYHLLTSQTMRGLHTAILIKKDLEQYAEIQIKKKLKAGKPCGLFGNKGATSIQVSIHGKSFQFINCHLAANQECTQERNITLNNILNNLVKKNQQSQIILMGDLNYRIQMTKQQYKNLIKDRQNTNDSINYLQFLPRQQLKNQKFLQQNFLTHFQQGQINFPPTYKIGVQSKQYCKQRIAGWTDRIFHKKSGKMRRISYGCQYNIFGSDHRPILARYQIKIDDNLMSTWKQNLIPIKTSKCEIM